MLSETVLLSFTNIFSILVNSNTLKMVFIRIGVAKVGNRQQKMVFRHFLGTIIS